MAGYLQDGTLFNYIPSGSRNVCIFTNDGYPNGQAGGNAPGTSIGYREAFRQAVETQYEVMDQADNVFQGSVSAPLDNWSEYQIIDYP